MQRTATPQDTFRVTYSGLAGDAEAVDRSFRHGLAVARGWLGEHVGMRIDGRELKGSAYALEYSPIDRDVIIGRFAVATTVEVHEAVAAARRGFAPWAARPLAERAEILANAADVISKRRAELAALCSLEVGKNRLEALGDVEEAAELIRYAVAQATTHGLSQPMEAASQGETNEEILRPYGVWAVISPFNFPAALAAGPVGAALLAGNTVVAKPSVRGAATSTEVLACLLDAGVPDDALQILLGPGPTVGAALARHPDVDGITFTGSRAVGMEIYRTFGQRYPKPVICEMGGKNATIVTASADLDAAAEGVVRSAFGFGGQKCSATSRVYVDRGVGADFVARLLERAGALAIGDPTEAGIFLGPVIDESAAERYRAIVADLRTTGRILHGGTRLAGGIFDQGCYLPPTVVEAPLNHRVWTDELFLPVVAVAAVDGLEDALALANGLDFGLTAGLFSDDDTEIARFLDGIEAGVVYVNRRAGATTGAWPGAQPFGGWKASGSTGRGSGGPHYLTQYLREQSRTVIRAASSH